MDAEGGGRDLIQRYVLERVAQYATLLWHVILNNLQKDQHTKTYKPLIKRCCDFYVMKDLPKITKITTTSVHKKEPELPGILERVAQYATLLWHVILNNLKQNSDHKRKQNGHPRGMCVI